MPDPLIGRTLLHYHIVKKIGQGGMGAVYLAHDPRLQRNVAVKVLASPGADERRRQRFVREARTASALNHPHIVTIHDIAQDGGVDFIVMEWVDGRPLDALIPLHGLPIRDAVEYALQIADAVASAHRAGIVHRDLKPANVIATASGRIRVLDFGLAKLSAAGESEGGGDTPNGLTQAGTVLGTFAYMSPEQAIGREVDHRTDIFSFAAMLYEMLSGKRPFAGPSTPAIIHALHYSEPKPLATLRPDVPAALAQMVHAGLGKDPDRRTASMETVYAELKAIAAGFDTAEWTPAAAGVRPAPASSASTFEAMVDVPRPPAAGTERASLAVLPFTSLSADPEDSYLAAGITAELSSALSGVPDLRVASHLASARFQGGAVDFQAVASALHIRYILTGSVRHAKNRVRVSTELTDAVLGSMLWSKTYEGGLEDIFEVQEDIARQIVSAMGGELIRAGSERASRTAPENLDAWGLVRRAYHFWNHAWRPEGVEDALNLLRRAVELDPSYAAARAFLGLYLIQRMVNFISPNPEADMREALAAASTAVDLAPRDPEVLENVGLVYFNTGQYENAVAALKRAVQIAPFNLVAWGYLGLSHAWSGGDDEVDEGRRILERLLRTAPDHPSVPYWLYFKTAALTRQARFADAADAARQSTERQPYFYIARLAYANALGALGETDRARVEIERVLTANPTITPEIYAQSVYLLARDDARAANHLTGLRAAGWIAPANKSSQ